MAFNAVTVLRTPNHASSFTMELGPQVMGDYPAAQAQLDRMRSAAAMLPSPALFGRFESDGACRWGPRPPA